jgi:tripartite-type tricarboxylate transporter receptor subunit TctC
VAGCALILAHHGKAAQSDPVRPVRIVCPCGSGSTLEFISRTVSSRLAEQLGVPVIVENRPGANGMRGSEVVVNSPPDGHTLLIVDSKHALNPVLGTTPPYDSIGDFAPIVQLGYIPLLLVVHASLDARSLPDLISFAKTQPDGLRMATADSRSVVTLAAQVFQSTAGLRLQARPYPRSAPALVDLLAGKADMMFDLIGTSFPLARSGRLRMLAVTSPARAALAPDVPTMAEMGIAGFDVRKWFVVMAPNRITLNVVTRLNAELNKVLADPAFKANVSSEGFEIVGGTSERASAYIKSEIGRWQKLIKDVMPPPASARTE